ncbi:MAG TPA: alkaline phosphatase family protein [Tepidisphaeraceae bacterium]|jgi:acid phosphatase|nr:alkaline phosphatase family protein [Tepidisphaeraceae bacterium]
MRRLIKRLFGSRSFKSSPRLPRVVEPLERRQLLSAAPKAATAPPRYDHVIVVIEENHAYNQILGASEWPPLAFPTVVWPFLNQPLPMLLDPQIRGLASAGAVFTNSHGITHPSEPNYLALFSGSTQGVTSDAVPRRPFTTPSLAGELLAAGDTFASYSQGLPHAGYQGGDTGNYVRHHAPWTCSVSTFPSSSLRRGCES